MSLVRLLVLEKFGVIDPNFAFFAHFFPVSGNAGKLIFIEHRVIYAIIIVVNVNTL